MLAVILHSGKLRYQASLSCPGPKEKGNSFIEEIYGQGTLHKFHLILTTFLEGNYYYHAILQVRKMRLLEGK